MEKIKFQNKENLDGEYYFLVKKFSEMIVSDMRVNTYIPDNIIYLLPSIILDGNREVYQSVVNYFSEVRNVIEAQHIPVSSDIWKRAECILYLIEDILYLLEQYISPLCVPVARPLMIYKANNWDEV